MRAISDRAAQDLVEHLDEGDVEAAVNKVLRRLETE